MFFKLVLAVVQNELEYEATERGVSLSEGLSN